MAKIHEELVVIKFSKLVRDGQESQPMTTSEIKDTLASVAQELAGAGVVVEVESA